MRSFALFVAVGLCWGLASAEQPAAVIALVARLPGCALPCLANAIQTVGCTLGDMSCTCVIKTSIAQVAAPCVMAACTPSEFATTKNITDQACAIFQGIRSSSLASLSREGISTTFKDTAPTPHVSGALVTPTASTTLVTSTTSAIQQAAPETGSPSSSPVPASHGLSTNAKRGIGVGVGVGGVMILAILGAIVRLCVLGHKRKDKDMGHLQWLEKRGVLKGRVELQGQERIEMEAPVWEEVKKDKRNKDELKPPLSENTALSPISPLPPTSRTDISMPNSAQEEMVSPITPVAGDRANWI